MAAALWALSPLSRAKSKVQSWFVGRLEVGRLVSCSWSRCTADCCISGVPGGGSSATSPVALIPSSQASAMPWVLGPWADTARIAHLHPTPQGSGMVQTSWEWTGGDGDITRTPARPQPSLCHEEGLWVMESSPQCQPSPKLHRQITSIFLNVWPKPTPEHPMHPQSLPTLSMVHGKLSGDTMLSLSCTTGEPPASATPGQSVNAPSLLIFP